jgi:uncharacterized protein (TIGR02246 family)
MKNDFSFFEVTRHSSMEEAAMRRRIFVNLAAMAFASASSLTGMHVAYAADDEAAIREMQAKYVSSWLARDAEAYLSLWDEDAVQLPNGAPARGKDVLKVVVPKMFSAAEAKSFDFNPDDLIIAGDWAFSRGTFDLDQVVKGNDMHIEGKSLGIFKRQADGSWKIYWSMTNSNTP